MNIRNIFSVIFGGALLLLAVIAGAIWIIHSLPEDNQALVFSQEGNIIKDTPGLKPDVWYLSYEQPGTPALTQELDLSDVLSDNLQKGERVVVKGSNEEGIVKVSDLRILNAVKDDLIWVSNPLPNQAISSTLTVNGYARGNWYFEASFPISLLDENGKVVAQAIAQAQDDWMTTNYVPFTAKLTFSQPTTANGTLVLKKDNPSGLGQNDNELRIPIRFDVSTKTMKLYFYDSAKDKDASGNILCSNKGLVAVDREVVISQTPIQDVINLLLQGRLTTSEKAQGISTEYPLTGLTLKGASLNNGTLTLEFADPQNKTGGGSCRAGVLWAQIEATAKQFSEVTKVVFKPDALFQP